jgi:hypothetical protein
MRRIYPLLFATSQPTKPSTFKRFDSVMTAIGLFISLAGWSFSTTLAQLLQLLYGRIVSQLFGDAVEVNNKLKRSRILYFNVMRGGRAFAELMNKGSELPFLDAHGGRTVSEVSVINRLIDYRTSLIDSNLPPIDIVNFDRVILAILSLDRIMTYTVDLDFSSITNEGSVHPSTDGSLFFPNLNEILEVLGITPSEFRKEYRKRCRQHHHLIISTSGPNGPATWTAMSDARAIMGNTQLYRSFKVMAEESKMSWLVQDMTGVCSIPSYDSTSDHMIHAGRLHDFEEWGGKRRIVAIVDYWTQTLLTPLHDTIFHFLKLIEPDGTFDQDAAAERVRSFTGSSGAEVYSFDLTAATDRLPIWLQKEILSTLIGPSLATHWATLLTAREYHHRETNKSYKYAVGQPMGAKSSWAMLALTHHVILQAAAKKVSSSPYNDYAILGDDIVLTTSPVASQYQAYMKTLGVNINLFKSVTHHGDAAPAAEFAKRLFMSGIEYTTFPVKLIAKTIMNGRLAPQLQNELARRGMDTSQRNVLAFLTGLIDKDSGTFLTILNALPTSLSAITKPCTPGGRLGQIDAWYGDRYRLTVNDIRQAFIFTAVTEQLKRLDTLLRQAQTISTAIETNAFGYAPINREYLGSNYVDSDTAVAELAAKMPQLSVSHPIVKAAQIEADRLAALLADLRTGDVSVTEQAQRRVLDMFRTSLVDSWADGEAARAQADRTLLQRSLTLLSDIIVNRLGNNEGQKAHFVDFTINLAFLNRLWTVSWELGRNVQINSVRSKVLSDSFLANDRLDSIELEASVADIFTPAPKGLGRPQHRKISPTASAMKAAKVPSGNQLSSEPF